MRFSYIVVVVVVPIHIFQFIFLGHTITMHTIALRALGISSWIPKFKYYIVESQPPNGWFFFSVFFSSLSIFSLFNRIKYSADRMCVRSSLRFVLTFVCLSGVCNGVCIWFYFLLFPQIPFSLWFRVFLSVVALLQTIHCISAWWVVVCVHFLVSFSLDDTVCYVAVVVQLHTNHVVSHLEIQRLHMARGTCTEWLKR